MADIKDCFACKYYDSSVDACNCDDKCYIDGAREFAEKIKSDIEKCWYRSELDMSSDNVNSLIDDALAEWQKGDDKIKSEI